MNLKKRKYLSTAKIHHSAEVCVLHLVCLVISVLAFLKSRPARQANIASAACSAFLSNFDGRFVGEYIPIHQRGISKGLLPEKRAIHQPTRILRFLPQLCCEQIIVVHRKLPVIAVSRGSELCQVEHRKTCANFPILWVSLFQHHVRVLDGVRVVDPGMLLTFRFRVRDLLENEGIVVRYETIASTVLHHVVDDRTQHLAPLFGPIHGVQKLRLIPILQDHVH